MTDLETTRIFGVLEEHRRISDSNQRHSTFNHTHPGPPAAVGRFTSLCSLLESVVESCKCLKQLGLDKQVINCTSVENTTIKNIQIFAYYIFI